MCSSENNQAFNTAVASRQAFVFDFAATGAVSAFSVLATASGANILVADSLKGDTLEVLDGE